MEIIQSYKTYLRDTNQERLLLSDSTMYRILKVCSERRKSLQGIDSYLAEGSDAYDDLFDIIDKLADVIDSDYAKKLKRLLLEGKQYLRTDYRTHLKGTSLVADHCAMYSLSDPNDQRFRLSCDNHPTNPHSNHSMRCSRCQQFKDSLGDMRSLIAELLKDARDDGNAVSIKRYEDLEADVHNAETKIINRKKHLLYKAEDYALKTYLEKIEEIDRSRAIPVIIDDIAVAIETPIDDNDEKLSEGWALKSARQFQLFSDDVKQFLDDQFDNGQRTGKKIDSKTVEQLMKTATDELGNRRFMVKDRLTARQIASYFSRRASKKRQESVQRTKREIEDDIVYKEMVNDEGK
uniref:Uncharacterized protein n=1 Tax=Acrobeloides nanus TaxID=290746 RepID=A0A914CGH7_9BILA